MPTPPTRRRGPVILLQTANLASGVGNSMVLIAIPWLVLQETESPLSAGIVAAISSVLGIFVSPLVGYLIDRFGRRLISVASDVFSALSVAAIPIVASLTELTFAWILVLAGFGAIFDPAGYTARKSLIPDVADAAQMKLTKLNGIHEGLFAVGWTVGPVLAAGLIATIGAITTFWVPFALFALAAICVAIMRVSDAGQVERQRKADAGEVEERFWVSAAVGIRVLMGDRPLRTITIAVMVLAAVYLPTESIVLPVYFEAQDLPAGLGIVIAALAAGSVIGSFGYGWLAERMSLYAIARLAFAGTAVSIIPLALLPPLPIMVIAALGLGLSWGPMYPLINTVIQRRVPADEQGRVFGAQTALFYAAPPLAMVAVGAAVGEFGVSVTYLVLGGLLAVACVAAIFVPSIREVND